MFHQYLQNGLRSMQRKVLNASRKLSVNIIMCRRITLVGNLRGLIIIYLIIEVIYLSLIFFPSSFMWSDYSGYISLFSSFSLQMQKPRIDPELLHWNVLLLKANSGSLPGKNAHTCWVYSWANQWEVTFLINICSIDFYTVVITQLPRKEVYFGVVSVVCKKNQRFSLWRY